MLCGAQVVADTSYWCMFGVMFKVRKREKQKFGMQLGKH